MSDDLRTWLDAAIPYAANRDLLRACRDRLDTLEAKIVRLRSALKGIQGTIADAAVVGAPELGQHGRALARVIDLQARAALAGTGDVLSAEERATIATAREYWSRLFYTSNDMKTPKRDVHGLLAILNRIAPPPEGRADG